MEAPLLPHAVLAATEAVLTQALRLDSTALPRLARLQGHVVALHCSAPRGALYLLPGADGLRLAAHWAAPATCTLQAPASRLLQLLASRDKTRVLHAPDVQLEGQSSVLLELAAILQDLEPDWEGALAERLGPLGALALARPLQQLWRWQRETRTRLGEDLADWLSEELHSLIGQREAEARFAELDALKLDLERLEARCARLARRLPDTD